MLLKNTDNVLCLGIRIGQRLPVLHLLDNVWWSVMQREDASEHMTEWPSGPRTILHNRSTRYWEAKEMDDTKVTLEQKLQYLITTNKESHAKVLIQSFVDQKMTCSPAIESPAPSSVPA